MIIVYHITKHYLKSSPILTNMKKSDTLNLYIDEFLEGKSEVAKEEFLSRSIDRQYASVMAWKQRKNAAKMKQISFQNVLNTLKETRKSIPFLENLSSADINKLHKEIKNIENAINDYEKMRAEQEILQLESEQRRITEKLNQLRKKI